MKQEFYRVVLTERIEQMTKHERQMWWWDKMARFADWTNNNSDVLEPVFILLVMAILLSIMIKFS